MLTKSLFCLSLAMICLFQLSWAQNKPMRWGRVSKQEWKLKKCAYDTLAEAVMLQSIGQIEFYPGRPVRIHKHFRIKILSKEGLKWANMTIPYYYKNNIEKIQGLRAQTINPSSGRKNEVTKLRSTQFFTEKRNDLYEVKKFAFPNVKVGSIIEYKYDLVTRSTISLDAWMFQDEIPTLLSQFKAKIGVEADYVVIYQGERLEKKYNLTARNKWELRNLSALRKEPFTNNRWDYAEKIEFQLRGYNKLVNRNTGMTKYVELMSTWPKLVNDVLKEPEFFAYRRTSFEPAKKILAELNLAELQPLQKVEKIYEKVKNHFTWDQYYRLSPRANLRKLWQKKTASGTGINVWLATLLKNAGFQAFPVLISTKSHGRVLKNYPLLSKFNHMITGVRIGNKYYLMDAIDKNCPYQLLPMEDLNGVGLTLESGNPSWVPLRSTKRTQTKVYATMNLAKGTTSLSMNFYGQEAYRRRIYLNANPNKRLVASKMTVGTDELPLKDASTQHLKDVLKPLKVEAKYGVSEAPDLSGILYIKPILWNDYEENPLKSPQRFYPLDFSYPYEDTYVLNLKIPNGYKVESMPKSLKAVTPDGSILFFYQIKASGNQLQLLSKVKVLKATVHHKFYVGVKELFDRIVEKYQEMIVLKKTSK